MKPNITLLVCILIAGSALGQQFPRIYKDSNFQGGSLLLDVSISNLHANGFGDNVSSCIVPAGWRLILYEHSCGNGATYTATGPAQIASFHHQKWGDCISSVSVFYQGELQGTATCPHRDPEPHERHMPDKY